MVTMLFFFSLFRPYFNWFELVLFKLILSLALRTRLFGAISNLNSRLFTNCLKRGFIKSTLIFVWNFICFIQSLKLTLIVRQQWEDYRCTHNFKTNITPNLATYGHPADHIWVPDTTLINMRNAKRHTKNDLLKISPDGKVFWSTMY